MKRLSLAAMVFFFLILPQFALAQTNKVSLTTYYPSPFGAYDRLRLVPRASLGAIGTACANQEGTLYIPTPPGTTINQCSGGTWQPVSGGVFQMNNAAAGLDPENNNASIDQYIPVKAYADLTTNAPYLGIGTNNPQKPLHVAVNNTGIPTVIALENTSPTYDSGVNLSFRGYARVAGVGTNFVEIASIKSIYSENIPMANKQYSNFIFSILNNTTQVEYQVMTLNGKYGSLGINTAIEPNAYLEVAQNNSAPAGFSFFELTSNPGGLHGDILTVLNNGKVGINNTAPTQILDVGGNVRATTLILTSDGSLKKDVVPVTNALEKVSRLKGVSFEWKNNPSDQRKHMGVIAQDVEKVFPEVVYGKDGAKGVDYPSLIAPLIEAVKELKQKNEVLSQQLQEQSAQIHKQQQKIESLENSFATKAPASNP